MSCKLRGAGLLLALGLAGAPILACRAKRAEDATDGLDGVEASGTAAWYVTRDKNTVPLCDSCGFRLVPVVTIGSPADPVLLRSFPMIVRDSRGFVYAVPHNAYDHEILMFAPDGRQVRSVGSFGQGPGEFRSVDALSLGRGDSLFVAHDSDRLTVFDPKGEFARTIRTPYFSPSRIPGSLLPLPSGEFIRAGIIGGEDSLRTVPFHRLSAEGEHLRTFGTGGIMSGDSPRFLAFRGMGGTLWSSELTNYRFEQFDSLGEPGRVLAVESGYAPAFLSASELDSARAKAGRIPPLHELYRAMPERFPHPPIPEIAGAIEHDGRLIVALRRAADNWQDVSIRWDAPDPTHVSPAEANKQNLYATQLDAINIDNGRVMVRTIVPGYGLLLNDGSFASLSYGEDGIIRVAIFSLTIEQ